MLPRIVIDFLFSNQTDVLIIQIYSVIKLCMFRADSAWKRSLETCMKLTSAECTVENPDNGQRKCPKHAEFYNRINLDN
jgi:hypothetical protein